MWLTLGLLIVLLFNFSLFAIATYSIRIKKGEAYKGFLSDVLFPILSAGGISNDFVPFFRFKKTETSNAVKLNKLRNIAVACFWFSVMLMIMIGIFNSQLK